MHKTPLHQEHLNLGARMTDFAGWDMPLSYAGIVEEVATVRTRAGIFDLSHMGEIFVSGPAALGFIQQVTTNDASQLKVGAAQYTLFCNESGGVVDDLVVYRTGDEEYLLVVNASNTEKDYNWMQKFNSHNATLRNASQETALIAIQGPESLTMLQPLVDGVELQTMPRFHIARCKVSGMECLVATTGYTGEAGAEILCKNADAVSIWNAVMEAGKSVDAKPVGLGARDVLRLEAGYPLYGHELDDSTTPVEAKLMWVVKPEKGNFTGREKILKNKEEGPSRILIGLAAEERCIPRQGCKLVDGQKEIGVVTSGTFSPTIKKGIALAYIHPEYRAANTPVGIQIRDKICKFKVVKTPFVKTAM